MDILEATVEITKAALPLNSGTWITNPEKVAEFIEQVYDKLMELNNKIYR